MCEICKKSPSLEIFNYTYINESYVKCYKNIISCYSTCETCIEEGDEFNHKCLQCKDEYKYINNSLFDTFNCYNKCDNYYYIDFSLN